MPTATQKPSRRKQPKSTAEVDLPWEVHIGFVKLAIIGPADHLWFAVSNAVYGTGPVGTDKERDRARRAVDVLNAKYPSGEGVTRAVIDSILAQVSSPQ